MPAALPGRRSGVRLSFTVLAGLGGAGSGRDALGHSPWVTLGEDGRGSLTIAKKISPDRTTSFGGPEIALSF